MNQKELENLEEKLKEKMQDIARMIKGQIPKEFGFILLTFAQNSNAGEMIYVSDSNREDVVKAMEEFVEKTKENYGNDTEKYGRNKRWK